ncbi:MAG: hypothetical protein H7144_14935 [Burkholderiales bacterium]|nr:hypothetical protein [Phycisphaerae bacterium]
MFDEPNNEEPVESPMDPHDRAEEKSSEFRMYAEIAAVFEGTRKFDARILPGLPRDTARDVQQKIARLEKSKSPDSPILPPASAVEAIALLNMPEVTEFSTNDYHVHARPGEVMMIRWLEGDEVEAFYERIQAHFEATLGAFRADERQANEWKQDARTIAYIEALEKIEVRMADRYLRDVIRKHGVFVLSTMTADEINIAFLAEDVMGVSPEELVGPASAPPDGPTVQDLAWFYKLFALRGVVDGVEKMCFFTFLQKSDATFGDD